MKIGLFIPCYVDALYPEAGVATYKLLTHLGLDVDYPLNQTCCGQPMANAGFERMAEKLATKFDDMFAAYDYVVAFCQLCCLCQGELSACVERKTRLCDIRKNHGCR